MKEFIRNAYERMTPDEQTRDELLQRIQMRSRTQNIKIPHARRRVLTAACVIMVIALSILGINAWQNRNPVRTAQNPVATGAAATGTMATGDKKSASAQNASAAAFTDEELTRKAMEILQTLDLKGLSNAQSHIARTENDDGVEAEVYFTADENIACVKFSEQTGELLGITCMDWNSEGTACMGYEEAERLAKQYYEMLPVPKGYVLTEYQELNVERWDFRFECEVLKGVYSPYEFVRISVDPQKGCLRQCSVHSVPLSDDHAPDDVPITAEKAEELARACLKNPKNYQKKSCEVEVIQPDIPEIQDFTRLSWCLSFENPNSEYEDRVTVYVDYYTGEILVMSSTQ